MTTDSKKKSSFRANWMIIWVVIFSGLIGILYALDSWNIFLSAPVSTITILASALILSEWVGRRTANAATSREAEMRHKMAVFFATITIESSDDERYAFDGRTATIMQDEESLNAGDQYEVLYQVKRFARNPSGEYFWLILEIPESGVPYLRFVKHVAHDVARLALKEKYIPPPEVLQVNL